MSSKNQLPNIRQYILVDKDTNKVSSFKVFDTRQEARSYKVSNERIVQLTPEKFVR